MGEQPSTTNAQQQHFFHTNANDRERGREKETLIRRDGADTQRRARANEFCFFPQKPLLPLDRGQNRSHIYYYVVIPTFGTFIHSSGNDGVIDPGLPGKEGEVCFERELL